MKRARVMVLAIAFTAALGAAWVAKKIVSGPREVEDGREDRRRHRRSGRRYRHQSRRFGSNADDLKWQQWPVEGITPGLITPRCATRRADQAVRCRCARALYRRRADQGAEADQDFGGRRDGRHSSRPACAPSPRQFARRPRPAASSFPMIASTSFCRTRCGWASKEEPVSEAVLRNVRVLAIGQEIENKDGEKVAAGKTATLELTPPQAETLALAQSMGETLAFLAQPRRLPPRVSRDDGQDRRQPMRARSRFLNTACPRVPLASTEMPRAGRITKKATRMRRFSLKSQAGARNICRRGSFCLAAWRRRRHGLASNIAPICASPIPAAAVAANRRSA